MTNFKFTLDCYHTDLIDMENSYPVMTLGGNDKDVLFQIGTAFLGKSIYTDSVENSCFTIYDNICGERVTDWGQGRPAPKMCDEVKRRLEEKAGVMFF